MISNNTMIVYNYVCFEYEIACKYNLNSDNYYYSSRQNIQKYTGLDMDSINSAILELERNGLLEFHAKPQNTSAEWFILNNELLKYFIPNQQYDENLIKNDLIIYSTLPPVYKYNEEILKIKEFIEQHSDNIVPTIVYSHTQAEIRMFEMVFHTKFIEIPQLFSKLEDYLNSPDYMPNNLTYFVDEIGKEFAESQN